MRVMKNSSLLTRTRLLKPTKIASIVLIVCVSPMISFPPGTLAQESAGYACFPDPQKEGWICSDGKDDDRLKENRTEPGKPSRRGQKPTGSATTEVIEEHSNLAGPEAKATAKATAKVKSEPAASDSTQQPRLIWNEIKAVDPNAQRHGAGVLGAQTRDPHTGVSLDPADWFVPSTPKATMPSHTLSTNLAADIYTRENEGDEAGDEGFCPGGYVIREYPHPVTVNNEDYAIVAEADALTSKIDVEAGLMGNVTIEQGNRLILAREAQLNQTTKVAEFPQGVRMDQPGLIMQGEQATVHLGSKKADLSGVQFVMTDANLRGVAETMVQNDSGDLQLTQNSFTRCEPENNGWSLQTSSLVIEEDSVFGTARNAVLKLKSVPVFYTPYLKFPISDERVSGFLFPNLGYSDEDGVDASIPYYLNLAPNYDATITPRYIGERGIGGELEFRHKSSWQTTVLGGAFLPSDDIFNGDLSREDFDELGGEAVLGRFDPADRWLGALEHAGRFGAFSTFADFTSVSDGDYFRDLGSDLAVSSRVELERRGGISYSKDGLFVRLWAQRFQRLDELVLEDYQRLPELEARYTTGLGLFEVSLDARWSEFTRNTDGLNGLAAVTGSRTHVEPRVRLPLSWPFGFLTVAGGYRYTTYDLEQDRNAAGFQLLDDNPDRGIGLGSVDGGLFFERDLRLFNSDLIQTLEPRVYYLYQEFDDQSQLPLFDASSLTFSYQQLFRDNRFSGIDRIGDANQASVGVTTRFLSQSAGTEYFRFSVGEIFFFDDRRVSLNGIQSINDRQSTSAYAAEMSARLAKNWRITGNTVWDPNDNEVDEGGIGIQYRRDNRHILNLGFRNRRAENIEQTDISLYWPISERFSVVGRWNYDLDSGRTIEGFGGLEYNDCCLQVRLISRRFLDSPIGSNLADVEADDGIFLQIVFKGLAGFGTKAESVLERGIRGYRPPNQQDYFSNP